MSETTEKPDVTIRPSHATDVQQFIADLGAGLFEQKVGLALSDAAAAAVDNQKVSEVTISFKLKHIANSAAVVVAHTIKTKVPTETGDKGETDTTQTPMHISAGGKMTIYPMGADTSDMFKDK